MTTANITWQINLLELLSLADICFDDIDSDSAGSLLISDGMSGRVYKIGPKGTSADVFSLTNGCTLRRDILLNIAASPKSNFYISDPKSETIYRYDDAGRFMGEFSAPGVVGICTGNDDTVNILSSVSGMERILCYDDLGSLLSVIPAPNCIYPLDSSLVSIDADDSGNIFLAYGMPPYQIWKIESDGGDTSEIKREIACSEDAILITDIDVSPERIWVLLAMREHGKQLLDSFDLNGKHIETIEIPHSDGMFDFVCSTNDSSGIHLLNTGMSGMGELAFLEFS